MTRHFLSLLDYTQEELRELLDRAKWLKKQQKAGKEHHPLKGKTLAMVFEKSSTRTRVSFEVGMYQLGGHALNITSQASQLGRGETYFDTAQVLSRYVNGIMMRTFEQVRIDETAAASKVPVINGLTDLLHPCQIMADMLTIEEHKGDISKQKVVWIGDGNNMANTWIQAAIIFGFPLVLACPEGFEPPAMILDKVKGGGYENIKFTSDPATAVKDADVINTDTWISMGQESDEAEAKKRVFKPFQVNRALIDLARKDAIVLHCLPAHREEEITSEVMDGSHSAIFDQAENRLHVQKAIMEKLMG
ncbi:MAG: ornithine carbamoyltransferase [Deltaproteobacteria bacterium CG11_big_fil_rev_8_21_14_0_20_49_13]|nr:MAG: ornithine carbamoyltransferase [Deltaproteobacteria bacterium CG11_big_fil_rev_8_21_14_0_20_49_13]